MNTYCDLIGEVRQKILEEAKSAFLKDEGTSKRDPRASTYADSVCVYLAMALSRHLQFGSTQSTWYVKDQSMKGLPQQGITMTWDYCEGSPFGESSANYERCVEIASECATCAPAIGQSEIEQRPAQTKLPSSGVNIVVCTDPPYYDNVVYADLADFFHIWLRRALRGVFPTLTATVVTPKQEELVATRYRQRNGLDPDTFWLEGMKAAFGNILATSGVEPITIFYAYKQQERAGEERAFSSTGWATFLQALHDTGFVIDRHMGVASEQSRSKGRAGLECFGYCGGVSLPKARKGCGDNHAVGLY